MTRRDYPRSPMPLVHLLTLLAAWLILGCKL